MKLYRARLACQYIFKSFHWKAHFVRCFQKRIRWDSGTFFARGPYWKERCRHYKMQIRFLFPRDAPTPFPSFLSYQFLHWKKMERKNFSTMFFIFMKNSEKVIWKCWKLGKIENRSNQYRKTPCETVFSPIDYARLFIGKERFPYLGKYFIYRDSSGILPLLKTFSSWKNTSFAEKES